MTIESIRNVAPNSPNTYAREQPHVRDTSSQPSARAVDTQTEDAVKQTPSVLQNKFEPIKQEELESALKKMNEFVGNSDILFTTDKDTGTQVVRVIDRSTKDLIRQFPSEEAINISKALDKLQGLLIRQKA